MKEDQFVTKNKFLQEYLKAIRNGNAALFAGAGLSRPSGFVVWKDLLRPLAEEIHLNIDEEHDFPAVAQYVKNESGNRAAINESILDAYEKNVEINENISILTRIPIYTYWTTNYDQLIEKGLRTANRNPDVKIDSKQLTSSKKDRDAVVYKMHGDVEHPADAVLTKDDYAQYEKNYPFFRDVLQGDLISKTFLFIGFSFEDPNLDYILDQLRLHLDENMRTHYCFMKRVNREDTVSEEDLGYKKAKQDLRERDLKRYGIQTVFVDEYSEITEVLRDLENAVLANSVFISGSADCFEEPWPKVKIEELSYKLAKELVKENFVVSSGFGLGIGSFVINGALDEIYNSKYKHISEHLCLHPFPQGIINSEERKAKWRKYREEIIRGNGCVIFIAGNKTKDGNKIIADGCMEEYQIAKNNNCIIIPIGTTGDAAKQIYDEVRSREDDYPYLEKYLDILGESTDVNTIVNAVVEILKSKRIS